MDVNESTSESVANNNNKLEDLFSTIKDSLVDISVELADIKKSIKKNSEPAAPNRSVSFESEETFLRFEQEIQRSTEKYNEFTIVLKKIFSNNENEIKSNLPKFYSIVLRACFNRNLMQNLSWNKYKEKCAVNSTRIFQAIQHSGSAVDSLSMGFDRQKILHKEFKKFKDSCRARKGKLEKGDFVFAHYSFWFSMFISVKSDANPKRNEGDSLDLLDIDSMEYQNSNAGKSTH